MNDPRPEIRGEGAGPDGSVVLSLLVPAAMPLFAGHFPGHPILPGVLQIHWAYQFAAERFAIDGKIVRMTGLKFQKPVLPDNELLLTLAYAAEKRQLSFAYDSEKGRHASGRLEFSAPASPT